MLDRIESKIFLLLLFSSLMYVVQLATHQILPITVSEIIRLVWPIWYVYKDLIWRAELCLCRFQFASYCCRWLQIVFISGLFFDSDCFFDYTRLCVTSAWFYSRKKCSLLVFNTSSKISTANWNSYPLVDETRPSKWQQRRVELSRPYVDIFSTNIERTSVLG